MTEEQDADRADFGAVEARIARELSMLADEAPAADGERPPPAYVRRHLAEHAAAGGVLNDRNLPAAFLPYIDPTRLHGAASSGRAITALTLLPVIRQVAHLWQWNDPARNAAAMEMWSALSGRPLKGSVGGRWLVRWAMGRPDRSDHRSDHPAEVRSVAAAALASGPVLVSGGADGELRILDARWGGLIGGPLRAHEGAVRALALLSLDDGSLVAVSGAAEPDARVWRLVPNEEDLGRLTGHAGGVVAVTSARLADGRAVVITSDEAGTIRTWSVDGQLVGQPLRDPVGGALGLATALVDGRLVGVASGRDSDLRLWDVASGEPIGDRLGHHPHAMTYETGTLTGSRAVATATVDGRAVAVVGNGDRLVLWDLLTRTPVDRYIATDASAARGSLAVGTLADDRPVVVAGYVDLGVWDLATGAKLAGPLSGHENTVESIATLKSPESPPIAASGSRDGTVRIWDLLPARPVADREPPLLGAVEKVAAGRLANGRGIALSCERSQVLVRDLDRGSPVRALLGGDDSPIMAVATATLPDGRAVAVGGGWDGTVRAWDLATGDQLIGGFAGHRRPVVAVETVPIGGEVLAAVTGSWDGTVGVWDIGTGAAIGAPLEGHDSVSTVAVVARPGNAAFIVSGGEDQRVVVWDLRTGSVVRHWDCPAPISAVAIVRSSDGRRTVVAGDQDGVIHRHDLYSGMPVGRRWTAHKGAVTAIVASRSDHGRTVIYTAGDSAVSPWDVDSAEPIGSTLPFPWPVRSLATARRRRARLVVGGVGIAVVEPKHGA